MAILKNTTINDTGNLRLPVGTTAQRPSPQAGQFRYNTTTGGVEIYTAGPNIWQPAAARGVRAAGGTVYDVDVEGTTYRVHVFTTTGNSTFTVTRPGTVEYLIVAGGGGGGAGWNGGGGGAGGLLTGTTTITPQAYTVTVGGGGINARGTGAGDGRVPTNGQNSSALGFIAIGGGAGASEGPNLVAQNGGSGGGGVHFPSIIPGNGTPGQGNAGGLGVSSSPNFVGGGGGGAGAPGQNATATKSGDGGQGVVSSIYGVAAFYAGGGGGAKRGSSDRGLSGIGGGGNGGTPTPGQDASVNTGGGGGAGAAFGTNDGVGGAGGSGIVVIRYPLQSEPDVAAPKVAGDGLFLDLDFAKPTVYSGTGTTLTDSRINGLTAPLSGTYNLLDTRTNRTHFNFNGGNVVTPLPVRDNEWRPYSSFAFEIWVKLTSYPQPLPTPNQYGETARSGSLIGATSYGGTSIYWDGNNAGTTCAFYGWIRDDVTSRSTTSYVPPLNQWTHFVHVNDRGSGANQIRFYVNGSLHGSANHTMSGDYIYSPGNISFPKADVSGGGVRSYINLPCQIAQVRLYTTYLTNSQVSENFNATRWRFGV